MPSITYPMTPDVTRTAFSSGRERGRIGDRACHHLPQPLSLARDRIVHPAPKLLLDLPHLGPFAVAAGPPKEQKPAAPRPAADMGEAEEVERLRLAKPRPFPLLRRPAAELDQTGLVRMQGQRKLRQPIPQFCLKPLGIGLVCLTKARGTSTQGARLRQACAAWPRRGRRARPPRPQSVPATTFSRPTIAA